MNFRLAPREPKAVSAGKIRCQHMSQMMSGGLLLTVELPRALFWGCFLGCRSSASCRSELQLARFAEGIPSGSQPSAFLTSTAVSLGHRSSGAQTVELLGWLCARFSAGNLLQTALVRAARPAGTPARHSREQLSLTRRRRRSLESGGGMVGPCFTLEWLYFSTPYNNE